MIQDSWWNNPKPYQLFAVFLFLLIFTGCGAPSVELAVTLPPETLTLTPTPLPSPFPTSTAIPTPTPEPTPTDIPPSGLVDRLCQGVYPPMGIFKLPEPYFEADGTIYELYQLLELGLNSSPSGCTLYLSPPPMGSPQLAGNALYWNSFNYEEEHVTVWQYDPDVLRVDGTFPSLGMFKTSTAGGDKTGLRRPGNL